MPLSRESNMADGYMLLAGLSPTATLKLLADFAHEEKDAPAFLRDGRILVEPGNSYAPEPRVSLAWPNATLRRGRRDNPAWTAFWGLFSKQTGHIHETSPDLPDGYQMLAGPGLAALLACSLNDASDVNLERKRELVNKRLIARPQQRERMLVASGIDAGRGAEIFMQLGIFATQRRTASAKTASDTFHLYHVMDDPERQSALDAAVVAGRFPECHLLTAYQSDEVRAGVSE